MSNSTSEFDELVLRVAARMNLLAVFRAGLFDENKDTVAYQQVKEMSDDIEFFMSQSSPTPELTPMEEGDNKVGDQKKSG